MAGEGKQLVECVRAVAAYAAEISSLCDTLDELLAKELGRTVLPCRVAGGVVYDDRMDENGWVYTDIVRSLPLMGKTLRNARAEMYLSYQISLMGNGMTFPGNDEPLLHVCLWADKLNFDEDEPQYMGFPLTAYPNLFLQDCRLVRWGKPNGDWKSSQWTFSLRLLSLDSSQALLDRIIRPAIALICDEPVKTALPDTLPGLVLYPEDIVPRAEECATD